MKSYKQQIKLLLFILFFPFFMCQCKRDINKIKSSKEVHQINLDATTMDERLKFTNDAFSGKMKLLDENHSSENYAKWVHTGPTVDSINVFRRE